MENVSDYGRYGERNTRNNSNRSSQGIRSQGQARSSSGSQRTSGGRRQSSPVRRNDGRRSVGSRQGASYGGNTTSSRNRIMEDERARVRARERKKRRRRRRKLFLVALVLAVLCLIGGTVYGFMRHEREKKKQELLREGIELLDGGSYEEAVKRLDEALQWSGGAIGEFETNVLLYRADAEYRLKSFDAALNTYELLMGSDEKNNDYKKGAARCMVQKGDYDGALALGVIDGYIYNLKAVEKIRGGEYDEALELIEKGKAAGDSGQDLAFNEAVVWENKGEFARALELFEAYAAKYGADENVERELTFLRSRQGSNTGDGAEGSGNGGSADGSGESGGSADGSEGSGSGESSVGSEGSGSDGSSGDDGAEGSGGSGSGENAGEESSPEEATRVQAVG